MVIGEGMVKEGSGAITSGLSVAAVAGTASLAVTAAGGIVLMANGSANAAAGYNYGSKEKSDTKGESKGSLSGTKEALKDDKGKIGLEPNESLPKGGNGKFGSPQRGDSQKRLSLRPSSS